MQNNSQTTIKISCTLNRVVAAKEAHFFVLVQLKPKDAAHSLKFRTDISTLTNRPNFHRNYFEFHIGQESNTLKFGLMAAKSQLDS